jgi:hypothetical protein
MSASIWSYRRAVWCALGEAGKVVGEGAVAADEDGLARLVGQRGVDVRAVVEMMSGAIWVRDTLAAAGWRVEIAHARKVRDVAPLACKTDKVDARVLAELCRRDLVPALWVLSLEDGEIRERLRPRTHLVRMRGSAMNRVFGVLTQWGLRLSLRGLRGALSHSAGRTRDQRSDRCSRPTRTATSTNCQISPAVRAAVTSGGPEIIRCRGTASRRITERGHQ